MRLYYVNYTSVKLYIKLYQKTGGSKPRELEKSPPTPQNPLRGTCNSQKDLKEQPLWTEGCSVLNTMQSDRAAGGWGGEALGPKAPTHL